MLLDIHSHILPAVDDGAKNIEASIQLLEIMQQQGITDVIATPHFYPQSDTIEEFKERVSSSLELLNNSGVVFPNIILGCELFYFNGISKSEFIYEFTINKSRYILLEPDFYSITKGFIEEILYLKNEVGLIPIIPHIERYHKTRGYRAFLKFIKNNKILTQVNAASFFDKSYNRTLKKLFKNGLVTFVATDTHSKNRPPMMDSALLEIEKRFSKIEKDRILLNLQALYTEITFKEDCDEIKYAEYL
ncbi:MAG: hypothetical protein IJD00_03070 [Clostridia bacterium]|nr:hypothetical protein [Clostridia bacterium]